MKSRILSAMFGIGMALSPVKAEAQASLDPAVRIGQLEELVVLDDSTETWEKVLHVTDAGKPGNPAYVGLKSDKFTIGSKKAPRFNGEYKRDELQYCIIDRDPKPDRDPLCDKFPKTGRVEIPEWATNGYFTFFLEVPSDTDPNKVGRADEYLRLRKPTGTRRFTRAGSAVASTPVPAEETLPAPSREEDRRTVPGGRRFDERRDMTDDRGGGRIIVSGAYDTSEGAEAEIGDIPLERAAPRVQREGINSSARLRSSPDSSLRTTDAENPGGSQIVSLDNAVTGELALGYDARGGSAGIFGSINRIRSEDLKLTDLWFGIAAGVDGSYGRRNEFYVRGNAGPYFHRMEYSVGNAYSVEQKNRRPAAAFGGSLEMPRLILNTDVFSLGLFDELFARQLNDLTSENDGNKINYGSQTTLVNRVGPKFGFRAGRLNIDLSAGWEYARLPTIRPNTARIPEMPLKQQPLADYQTLSNDVKRRPFLGHQLVASLDFRAGNLSVGGFYSHPVSGDLERNAIGVFVGYGNNLRLGYEFSDDSVEMAGERRRENTSHSGIIQVGTDFDRLLIPNSAIAPSPVLR